MNTTIKYSILFWIIFYVLVSSILSGAAELDVILIRVGTFVLPQVILFYLNLLVLQPHYLELGKKVNYFALLIGTSIVFLLAFGFLDLYLDEEIPLNFRHMNERPTFHAFLGRFMSLMPPIIISALIRKSILLQEKTRESFLLQNKMLEAETKALKAQINPHFLFNTLNNIYSLSQFDNKKTGEAILQLSDILRYVTYDGNETTVSLSAELALLESFIKLQLLRDDDDSNIEVKIAVDQPHLKISPLLLLPFVENCFKHSNHHDKENGWIKISIRTKDSTLILEASNSTSDDLVKKDKVGGVGMENVRKRLTLLYPKQHDLVLRMDKTFYASILKIHLES